MKKGSKVRRIAKSCPTCSFMERIMCVNSPEINDEATVLAFEDDGTKMTLVEYGESMLPDAKFAYHTRDFIEVEPPAEVEVVEEIKEEVLVV